MEKKFNSINFDINNDTMRFWRRRFSLVPKGFVRYQVLELLNERPMSGSEIMEEIEKRTNGLWKPSPGSIYPLLSWLQDNNYVREVQSEEGLKRYTLTEKGRNLLEEHRKMLYIERGKKSLPFFMTPFPFLRLLSSIPPEKARDLQESIQKLFFAFFKLRSNLEKNVSIEAIEETCKVLEETTKKIEEIEKKYYDEKNRT